MPVNPLSAALQEQGALVLDGALATELERHGADLSGKLWSARLLLERPELIARVHRDYLGAGADVITTASYQASLAGFVASGLSRADAAALLRRSVTLAREERDAFWASLDPARRDGRLRPLVATSVGPYGAVLADGSEYSGHYDIAFDDLVAFHRERLALLIEPGVEVLAGETIPSLLEARALVEALRSWPEVRAWVSFSARSETEVSDGTPAAACAAFLQDQPQVVAVGINCTSPTLLPRLVQELRLGTDRPILVYPNSGETYDAGDRSWRGPTSPLARVAAEARAAGARIVGGCCRTRPADVAAIRTTLTGNRYPSPVPASSGWDVSAHA